MYVWGMCVPGCNYYFGGAKSGFLKGIAFGLQIMISRLFCRSQTSNSRLWECHRVISKLPAIWLMPHLRWDQAEMIIRINDHQDIYRMDEAPAHDSCHVLLYIIINRIWI